MTLVLGAAGGALLLAGGLRARGSALLASRERLLAEARRDAERSARDAELRLKDEEIRRRELLDRQAEQVREEWRAQEDRLARREAAVERKSDGVDERERALEARARDIEERREDIETRDVESKGTLERARQGLQELAGMTRDEAANALLGRLEDELRDEAAARIRKAQERIDAETELRAAKVLAHAVQRLAVRYVAESVTATVPLPDDAMKGRIIGREGRNVRVFEKAAGVDVIIDDTPGIVVVSCFDNVRREVARRALERLIQDGRIHPARIEEVVAEVRADVDDDIRQTARKVLAELDVPRVDPRMQFCLGRLKYRTSYGQNQLEHAIEASYLAAAMAAEMKLNPRLAKRCALLHDVGKALDHELEGGHAAIGADLARSCGERPEVVNAIAAHHGDVPFESPYAVLAQVADAISAARPGARRDTMEKYVDRLERLEAIAGGFQGVEGAFAIQAGREIRVMVDAATMDDAQALVAAREIAKRIESELTYPGEIKVTVIRETRVTEYAR